MFEPTTSLGDAASTSFNLPDYCVIDALELPEGRRQVVVESTAPPGCPVCGLISARVHSRRRQIVRDVPVGGPVQVVWDKRRWFCEEAACPRGTFSESTATPRPAPRAGRGGGLWARTAAAVGYVPRMALRTQALESAGR